ncbi:TATA-box-binding protein-like [Pyrus communis]|uniref:TATA-box-binding protein-like n=1 Tax=Pyrus communis TaxID=23211 RepID=UPI0035BFF2DB
MEAQGFNQYQVNKTKGVSEEGSHPVVDLSKHPSGIVPTLQNIVSTVNLDCKLDLKAIALKARNSEYNPKACDVLSIASPAPFLLYFASGEMVCMGAKSEEQSRLAARKYARVIQKLGFPAKFQLLSLSLSLSLSIYIYIYIYIYISSLMAEGPKFQGGYLESIVISMIQARTETYEAFENIYPVLTGFRKNQHWYEL